MKSTIAPSYLCRRKMLCAAVKLKKRVVSEGAIGVWVMTLRGIKQGLKDDFLRIPAGVARLERISTTIGKDSARRIEYTV